nr:hypothetical protein [Tanacetum cinerariifolium]
MNAILVVYTKLDEVTNLQCDYLELLQKCECLETELSKRKMMVKSFESVQKHAINLELELQQCKEKIKNDMSFKVNKSKDFCKDCAQYFEIQDLKAQLQDKGIVISELKKLIEKLKGKSVDTKFEKSSHAMCVLKSVAKPLKKTAVSESNKKPRNLTRKLYERVSKTCSWWYSKFTPSGYIWKPKSGKQHVNPNASMPLGNVSRTANVKDTMTSRRSIVSNSPLSSNSFEAHRDCSIHHRLGCSKHMTGNLKLLINFVEKFLGTIKFRNDQIVPILGYGDLVQRAVTIKRVYFVEGLNHNLFSVGSCGMDLYLITLQNSNSPNPICLMAKETSSQAWLWHRRLSHLNFNTINLLSKNDIVVVQRGGYIFYTWTMRVASINGKRYVLVIVDDYSRYTWTHILRSKDETPEVLIDFLRLVQRGLQAQVRVVRTDKGTEFLNQTLHAYFFTEGIQHQTSVISILKQQKDAQIKLYKNREDKDIEKVIDLENKVKVLDNIVYKTGQSVQTMNMLNNKCRTSFAKPEYLKKAKQANPRL